MFSQALTQVGTWRAEGLRAGISINVFAGMLNQSQLPDQIVALAQRLDLHVVAEKVEDQLTLDLVSRFSGSEFCKYPGLKGSL